MTQVLEELGEDDEDEAIKNKADAREIWPFDLDG